MWKLVPSLQIIPIGLAVDPDSTVNPYVDANATWTYNPGSLLRSESCISATRRCRFPAGLWNADTRSGKHWGIWTVNHRISPKLTGSLLAQFQHSTFQSGLDDGKVSCSARWGVNCSYQVNTLFRQTRL